MEHTECLGNLLLQMQTVAARNPGVRSCRLGSGTIRVWPWIGFNINGMGYFFYVSLQEPETVYLQRYDAAPEPGSFDGSLGELVHEKDAGIRWRVGLDLSLRFFEVSEVEQERILDDFFRKAFAYAQGLRPVTRQNARAQPEG